MALMPIRSGCGCWIMLYLNQDYGMPYWEKEKNESHDVNI